VQNLYGQAKDATRDAAVGLAKDAYENSARRCDSSQAVAKKVQDNPLGARLVAGGIGFALAMLMGPPVWRLNRDAHLMPVAGRITPRGRRAGRHQ
jgi:hypothetical protein